MCSGAGSGLPIVGGFIQGLGAINQGRQQRDYYWDRALQDDTDAIYERQLGGMRAAKVRKAGEVVKGQARAAYAASGVEVGRGTPVTTNEKITRNVEEDAVTQLLTGERRAEMLTKEAQGLRTAGSNATTNALLSAWGSMLGGAASSYGNQQSSDRWIRMSQGERDRTPSYYYGGE